MSVAFSQNLAGQIDSCGIVAVAVLDHVDLVKPLADALSEGGIRAVELALRTPQSLEALGSLKQYAPHLLLGAGTVMHPDQVRAVHEAGADFAVSAGTNRRVLETAATVSLPFAPGVMTPSEVETALECGCNILKIFPAQAVGGMDYLRVMNAPYRHLKLRYIALGGLDEENIEPYAVSEDIIAIGGSWIAAADLIRKRDWGEVACRARCAVSAVEQYRQKIAQRHK